jgi:putative aldouronate transport system permease protein
MGRKLFNLFNYALMFILIMTMIIPLVNVVAISFSTDRASMAPGIKLFPSPFSTSGYEVLFERINILQPVLNTIYVSVIGTLLHILLSSLTAYALNRKDFWGKRFFVLFMLFTMIFPFQSIMIPSYIVYKGLGLINSLMAIVVSGMVSAYTVLILQSFFAKIPRSLEEAALMDGATEFTIFRTVYLPLSKAGIATVTLFQFVGKWNNFMESVIFLNDPSKYTLQVALKNLIISSDITSTTDSVSKNTQMAGVVITIIPLIIVYVFLQRYFITGLTAGAVKE